MIKRVVKGSKEYQEGKNFIFPGNVGFYGRINRTKRRLNNALHKLTDIRLDLPSKNFLKYQKDKDLIKLADKKIASLGKTIREILKRANEEK